jgi:uncharacterized membrane protein YgaE (UPF0421/DUF939 family)
MLHWASRLGLSRAVLINSLRTAIAAVVSVLLARMLKLPEFYWAPISAIVILLSTINPLTLAWQRFAGTAVGVTLGPLFATFLGLNWIAYGVGIFVCGIVSAALRLGAAYRFAAIAFSIVLLIAHTRPPWIVATSLPGSISGNRSRAADDLALAPGGPTGSEAPLRSCFSPGCC